MFYIHDTSCISPQQSFGVVDLDRLYESVNNQLQVKEPSYEGIPTGILRRMGKAIRLGVGTAMELLKKNTEKINGIIIGTANGGMEDCIKFLNQIIDYDEGRLTPTNFVQSTSNAIAAQIGLLSTSRAYNNTHVHRGLAFENALLDAAMLLQENKEGNYLVGGADEISAYNYNIDYLGGWYKREQGTAADLYISNTPGSMVGEGAAMFLVNNHVAAARAKLTGLQLLHTADAGVVKDQLMLFLKKYLPANRSPAVFLSGENGDQRLLHYYTTCEAALTKNMAVARFKHLMGEYATVSSAALWLACYIISNQYLPAQLLKYPAEHTLYDSVLIYNNHKGLQHSFMLVEAIA